MTVIVDGVAASAASLIAMAGDTIRMRMGAWMLVHDPGQMFTAGRGTEDEHRKTADTLAVVGDAYAEIYAARAGISREEARAIMRAETVMDGEKAVDLGFADERDGEEAVTAAVFDYRIYANAPQQERDASESLGVAPGQEAVLAMFAGTTRTTRKKEPIMATKPNPAPGPGTKPTQPVVMPAPLDESAIRAEAQAAERQRVKRITEAARVAGVEMSLVDTLIDEGVSFEMAHERIMAAWSAKDDGLPRPGSPTTRILRDERETMRMGMAQAITAQMANAAPESDAAREYMAQSLVEMAAAAVDHRGPMRTAYDRQGVIEAAFHSTSDFPAIFENALNKRLLGAYQMAQPVYQRIAMRADFNDFRPHPMVNTGSFPLLKKVNEAGEIKFGTLGDKKETVVLVPYAMGLRLTRQMIINDDLGAIDRIVRTQGLAVARTEEAVFFAMFLSGTGSDGPTLTETNRQVFSTNGADLTKAGTGVAISVESVGAGRAAIQKQKGIEGEDLALSPSIILTGPDKQTEAEKLVADVQPSQASEVNPFSGRLTPISTPKITGNSWYLMADPGVQAAFMYGYLQGDAGPRMRMDEPFGMQGVAYTIERDFGCGAIDKRGVWKNPGA
ncbi:Clp protease ClpP [Citreimonas sp.]|uniref:Clp protease ClpP n=1 Tax=Citreimonas sp. TaxID=3036715 RepID=UPI004059FFC7